MPFIGAIDDSGDLEYVSILIGEKEKLLSIANNLPKGFVHLTTYDYQDKKRIIKMINLNGNIRVICMRFGYKSLVSAYRNRKKTIKNNYKSDQKFYNSLGMTMRNQIYYFFKDFLIANKLNLNDVCFEEDNDVIRNILKHCGIQYENAGEVHKVADCIAHANFKRWSLEGILEYNKYEFKVQFCNSFIQRAFRR